MNYTDKEIEDLYNIKLSKYINQNIEVVDELDDVLYEEAIRETLIRRYINERGTKNAIRDRCGKSI